MPLSTLRPFCDVDASRTHDLGEAMGYGDHCAALLEGVEAGSGHVEEYDGRVFDEEPGAGDALLLGVGGVQARQVQHPASGVDLVSGGFNPDLDGF